MIDLSQLALKTHTNFGCAASLVTLDKLVDRFPLLPVASPISDTSLTQVMRLAAHSTTSPTPTAMLTIIYNGPCIIYYLFLASFDYFFLYGIKTSLT
jgi:hypothetical protein